MPHLSLPFHPGPNGAMLTHRDRPKNGHGACHGPQCDFFLSPRVLYMNMKDDRLIELTLAGDHEAFGHLVRRYADDVYAVALRACGDRELAADLAQETFLKAHAALSGFDCGRPLRPWLLAVALNTARSALRAGRCQAQVFQGPGNDDAAGRAADSAPGPEDRALEGQRSARLEAMVRQLPVKLRNAVALRFWTDLSFAEVAESLGVSESAAKMRVYRALEQLRVLMDDTDQE